MRKRQIEVDVLMPFHRLDDYFYEAVSSVLESAGVKMRLILLDNRGDKSRDISMGAFDSQLERTGHSVEIISVKGPNTYANALNIGIRETKADYFALMNSDDLVAPNRLQEQSAALIREDADIAICKLRKFSGEKTIASMAGTPNLKHYSDKYLLIGAYGADASAMFKTSWISLGQRTFPEAKHSDWEFALRNYSEAKIVGVDEYLYFYRMHHDQYTRTPEANEIEIRIIDLLKEHFQSIGISIQNNKLLLAISSPQSKIKLSRNDMKKFLEICDLYLTNLESNEQKKDATRLLARRILILLLNPRLIQIVSLKWWPQILVQILELIRDLIKGSLSIKFFRI